MDKFIPMDTTVESLYKGHPWDPKKWMALIEGWVIPDLIKNGFKIREKPPETETFSLCTTSYICFK